jgi:ankyrin repeat protein
VYQDSDSQWCAECTREEEVRKNPYLLWKCRDWRGLPAEERGIAVLKAARQGHVDEMRTFLAEGEDINVRDENDQNRTPLHLAAANDRSEVLKVLLEVPKPPARSSLEREAVDENGDTALHVALAAGRPKPIKLLLQAGLSTKARNRAGRTPIMEACRWGRSGAVMMALKTNAEVNAAAAAAKDAFVAMEAAQKSLKQAKTGMEEAANTLRAKELRAKCHLKPAQKKLAKAEAAAARIGLGLAQTRLAQAEAALEAATKREALASMAYEAARAEQLEQRDADGCTLLLLCCSGRGMGRLHPSCLEGRLTIVRGLMDLRADLRAVDDEGRTALMHACLISGDSESVPIAVALMDAARDAVRLSDHRLETRLQPCLDQARSAADELRRRRDAETLRTKRAELDAPLAAATEYCDRVEQQVRAEAERKERARGMIDAADRTGWTALHAAALRGSEEMCRVLLDGGQVDKHLMAQAEEEFRVTGRMPAWVADLDFHSYQGCLVDPALPNGTTPLMVACGQAHSALALLLVERGASLSARDRDGRTPLHRCAHAAETTRSILLSVKTKGLAEVRRKEMLAGIDREADLRRKKRAERYERKKAERKARRLAEIKKRIESGGPERSENVRLYERMLAAPASDPSEEESESEEETKHPWDKPPELTERQKKELAERTARDIRAAMSYLKPLVDARDAAGRTPLHVACTMNCAGAVAALCEYGADVDAADDDGNVCLESGATPAVREALAEAKKSKDAEILRQERLKRSTVKKSMVVPGAGGSTAGGPAEGNDEAGSAEKAASEAQRGKKAGGVARGAFAAAKAVKVIKAKSASKKSKWDM